jgi:hypothetical protein
MSQAKIEDILNATAFRASFVDDQPDNGACAFPVSVGRLE